MKLTYMDKRFPKVLPAGHDTDTEKDQFTDNACTFYVGLYLKLYGHGLS